MKRFLKRCIRKYQRWKRQKEADENSILHWLWEFSKKVVIVLSIYYFVQSIFINIMLNIIPDSSVLSTLIVETNETFRVVIGGYLVKAGVENAVKICVAVIAKKKQISINNEGSEY